jgi:hypothetical protein
MNNTHQDDKTNTDAALDTDILLELYRQACIDSREYNNLKYKRFAIYIAITAIIGAVAFEIPELHPYHATVCAYGVLMTILFWLLDSSTETFHQIKLKRIKECEIQLGVDENHYPVIDENRGIPIAFLMHLVFGTILLGWVSIEVLIITTHKIVF